MLTLDAHTYAYTRYLKVSNSELEGNSFFGLQSSNNRFEKVDSSDVVMTLGTAKCTTHNQDGDQSMTEVYADVLIAAETVNNGRRRRRDTDTSVRNSFISNWVYCECEPLLVDWL